MLSRITELFPPGTSHTEMSIKTGIPNGVIGHIFTGRNKISVDVITKIHYAFPNISLNWLMYGEGLKYIDSTSNVNPTHEKAKESIDSIEKKCNELTQEIERLKNLI